MQTLKEPAPDSLWRSHLAGEGPFLGVIPITDDDTCYWGALDVDDPDTDHQALARQVSERGLPLTVCRSKSGGAHLYCFFIEPVPAADLVSKLKRWQLALKVKNPDGRPVEIFPKQTSLGAGSVGNWINLPYYGGDDTNRFAVAADGHRLTLTEFLDVAEGQRLTHTQFKVKEPSFPPSDPRFFDDGPPCLQKMVATGDGFSAGNRNQALYNVGIYLKVRYPDTWESRIETFNDEVLDPALERDEVDTIIRSLERKDYVYKCDDAPIVHFCQRAKCRKRRFGIEHFLEKHREEAFPDIVDFTKFETDPPYYTFTVNGKRVRIQGAGGLRNYERFSTTVFEQANYNLPILKYAHWHRKMNELLARMSIVEPPRDAGATGQLLQLTAEFLDLRRRSESRESLLLGKPYQEKGKIYFRSRDLLEFLDRKRFRLINAPSDVWSVLRVEGAGSTSFTVKDQEVYCWWLPADQRNGPPASRLSLPVTDRAEF